MADEQKIIKRTKLIFLAEYIFIGLVLLTLGLLRILDVIPFNSTRLLVYNIITTVGAAYLIFDFIWVIVSKKKKEKACMLDKILTLIPGLYLVVFNIICFAKLYDSLGFYQYSVGAVLLYAGLASLFMGIYHHYRPTKQILEAIDEIIQESKKEAETKENEKN